MNYLLTNQALNAILTCATNDEWLQSLSTPSKGEWNVLAETIGNTTYIIHRSDDPQSARIFVNGQGNGALFPAPAEAYRAIFTRISWLALAAETPPVHLPPGWSEYHSGNLLSFFACPRQFGAYRWIAEMRTHLARDICMWRLTSDKEEILLENYTPPTELYQQAVHYWDSVLTTIRERFKALPSPVNTAALQTTVDLDAIGSGAVSRYRTYSAWLGLLTAQQRNFIEASPDHSVKLRGPAGSGKTLTLELKALKELYSPKDPAHPLRILFVTHSWAIAEQIDLTLRALDEQGDLSSIDIFPLLTLARLRLPSDRADHRVALLGEDSLSGKQEQLRRIGSVVERLRKGDWISYQKRVSDSFRKRVEAEDGSPERNGLIWDLMLEFSSVLSAHGILPGVNAERKYLSIQRTPWMMPLLSEAEKRFVLQVYGEYVDSLKRNSLLTSDQLINDFLNHLSTFTWNLQRSSEGYDLIFVDELHLFNEQERLVLNYLTRNPDEYPRIFMALDPRQAPYEVYAGFPVSKSAQGDSGTADELLGSFESLELKTVHRFTPEILSLVKHINRTYPTLDLGTDWELDLKDTDSSAKPGTLPRLYNHATAEQERSELLRRADLLYKNSEKDARVAIVLLDPLALLGYQTQLGDTKQNLQVIASRDDVANLRYAKKSIIVGAAEYVAGLQFDQVIIGGLPHIRTGYANLGHQLRRFLSLMYLAISRASRHVEIHTNDEAGGVPDILESAAGSGLLELCHAQGGQESGKP